MYEVSACWVGVAGHSFSTNNYVGLKSAEVGRAYGEKRRRLALSLSLYY
jgi:hypothetical protein